MLRYLRACRSKSIRWAELSSSQNAEICARPRNPSSASWIRGFGRMTLLRRILTMSSTGASWLLGVRSCDRSADRSDVRCGGDLTLPALCVRTQK